MSTLTKASLALIICVVLAWVSFQPGKSLVAGLFDTKPPLDQQAFDQLLATTKSLDATTLLGKPGLFYLDAGNLVGQLSVDRYSAYDDLVDEGKIPSGAKIITDKDDRTDTDQPETGPSPVYSPPSPPLEGSSSSTISLTIADGIVSAAVIQSGLKTSLLTNDANFLTSLLSLSTDDLSQGSTNLYSQWQTVLGGISYDQAVTLTSSLTVSAFTTNGGLLYTTATGQMAQLAAGTAGQCLKSTGAVPTWGACAATNSITGLGTNNYLAKFNGTDDLVSSLIYDDGINLGIGTASPSYKLDVAGDIGLGGGNLIDTSSVNAGIIVSGTNTGRNITLITQANGATIRGFGTGSNSLILSGGAADQLYLNNAGNVGIGTTSLLNKLDIAGAVAIGSYAGANTAPTNGLIISGNVGIGTATVSARLSLAESSIASGGILFGTDTNLYRTDVNTLATDDVFVTRGNALSIEGSSPSLVLYDTDSGHKDGQILVNNGVLSFAEPSVAERLYMDLTSNAGTLTWVANTTNLYSSAANTLKTDDLFIADGGLRVGTSSAFQVNTSGEISQIAGTSGTSIGIVNSKLALTYNSSSLRINNGGSIGAVVGGSDKLTIGSNGITFYDLNFMANDGASVLKFSNSGSANQLTISNAAASGTPTISATGTDTNIGINITPKGSGNTSVTSGNLLIPANLIVNSAGNPGGSGVNFTYSGSDPDTGPAVRWSDGTLSNTLGLYISSGLNYQGNSANTNLSVREYTGNGSLGTVRAQLGGTSTADSYFTGGNVGIGTATPTAAKLDIISTGTTTHGASIVANSLTTGKGLSISSTSTALTTGGLLALSWVPGSATAMTGDLFSLNVGPNGTVGNLFNLMNDGLSIFSVSQSQITANVPVAFMAAGDMSVAYDLSFTNNTNANIKSAGPLRLQAGEVFNSSDLTLGTYNNGVIMFDSTVISTANSTKLGLGGVYAPTARLSLVAGTTAADGIAFGTDTNLYRSAADTLRTDDLFVTGNALAWVGIAAPGLSSSGQAKAYFDSTSNTLKISENAGAYADILTSGRSISSPVTTKTSGYVLTKNDAVVLADATSGSFNLTLPSAVGDPGRQFTIIRVDSSGNVPSVNTTGGQTISGNASYALSSPYDSMQVVSNGANWLVISGISQGGGMGN